MNCESCNGIPEYKYRAANEHNLYTCTKYTHVCRNTHKKRFRQLKKARYKQIWTAATFWVQLSSGLKMSHTHAATDSHTQNTPMA